MVTIYRPTASCHDRHKSGRRCLADSTRSSATLADYQWLTGGAADAWLAEVGDCQRPTPALVERLRRELSHERTHLVLEQTALRVKARAKFAAASRMFFTPLSLEQATDEVVATHKARRFADSQRVLDLCCGMGGDLLALAHAAAANGEVGGVDRDAVLAHLAEHNVRATSQHGQDSTSPAEPTHRSSAFRGVSIADAREVDLEQCDAWHIDPDRRASGRRTTRVELHEPDATAIDAMLRRNPRAAIKLAPAATLPDDWPARAELEWISRHGECRQLVAWFGDLALGDPASGATGGSAWATAPRRRATVLAARGAARTIVGDQRGRPELAANIGRYVYEPDAAVLAAGLQLTLAEEHGLHGLAAAVDYWTGDRAIDDAALDCFEVLEVLPFSRKLLKQAVAARRVGNLEIKKRGVELNPDELRLELRPRGDASLTLIVTPCGGRVVAILSRRA